MTAQSLLLFVLAGLLLNLTPGPDVAFIVRQALRDGTRAGVVAALGISAGCSVHILAGTLGVSALLATSATAFNGLKWLGAAWLVWMGLSMLRRAPVDSPVLIAENDHPTLGYGQKSLKNVFWQGVGTNALNPKVALFFLAFVPQFISPQAPHKALLFLVLGLLFSFNAFFVNAGWAWLGGRARQRLAQVQPRLEAATRWLDRTAGVLFIGFGLKLALTDPPHG